MGSLVGLATSAVADVIQGAWSLASRLGTLGPNGRRARGFARFGWGSAINFPINTLYGEQFIAIGEGTMIGPQVTLGAGDLGGTPPVEVPMIEIGDRVLIGKGSGIVAHRHIVIGDDVFTGHNVYITDANHGYEDVDRPIGPQTAPARPVRIGAGSWLGHGAIVLAGVHIGEHVVIGAGSVVTHDIPAYSVAVGNPARVIKRYIDGEGWKPADC